jgi:hypothetical protein
MTDADEEEYEDPDWDLADKLANKLEHCLCGDPAVIADSLARYLLLKEQWRLDDDGEFNVRWARNKERERAAGLLRDDGEPSAEYWWAAYAADRLGFTEHGGSVGSAWLTDTGRSWLLAYGEDQRQSAP